MKLNLFFPTKTERVNFIKKQFEVDKVTIAKQTIVSPTVSGIKNMKFKSSYKTIPGYWIEFEFQDTSNGHMLYTQLNSQVDEKQRNNRVFYPKEPLRIQLLEKGWLEKYQFMKKGAIEDQWRLFYQEIKAHIKYERYEVAYSGLIILLKYNPFFLKKYNRHGLLEGLAYSFEEQGNMGKAIKCLKMQNILRPHDVEPYLNMSSFYIINGMEEEAIESCQKGLDKHPDNEYLISNLVIALSNVESYEYAIDFLRKKLEKQSDNTFIWKLMGDVLYELENYKGAIESYKRALKGKEKLIEEFEMEVYNGIAACFYEQKEYKEAIKYFKKVLTYQEDGYALFTLSQIYLFEEADYKKALYYTNQMVGKAPENGYGQFQLGMIYLETESLEKARWHLYKARRMLPHYKPVHEMIDRLNRLQSKSSS
ncbi:TPR repeat-containing protein [Alkaliphilus metalliredigens QYMF]|uniref:TPR repeat-containing protein n=1 Tax=Alkaliphilus metalliredigens (strain QYMF) TaxID=293826 RepID=A6TSN3_ALKMQ|nr:tetratricopeptide repeat protein [Alkaliphilus metalliredigens]ABR49201.1 TPR repeat-containing protein [Alkaliphilus metalliredigens QYMF]